MITVKILCACGQKYAFDVEPYHGRMPSTIQCPVCKADGTQAANEIIARSLPPAPIPAAAPPQVVAPPPPRPMSPASSPGGLRIGGAAHAPALKPVGEPETEVAPPARPAAAAGFAGLVKGGARAALRGADGDDDEDKWKWWYYVLAGIGIIGYQGWLFYENGFYTKYLSGIFGGLCCIGVGIWDFQRKRSSQA